MKSIALIAILIFLSFNSYSQKNYTFCYGSIAVTLLDGGNAEMVRYNSTGNIVSQVNGTFDLYGKGGPTETLKMKFQGSEYRYDLVRDGYGNPAKIFDNQMREYNLCKATVSSKKNNMQADNNLSFFVGTYTIPEKKLKIVISNTNGSLTALIYKNGKLFNFNTLCGKISKFVQAEVVDNPDRKTIHLTPSNCKEPQNQFGAWPNYISITKSDAAYYFKDQKFFQLSIDFNGGELDGYDKVLKEVNHN
ncbi:MAG: hypothetical protein KA527_01595 [Cytophagaceae bacterium]|nr:hypothetical protein [Cytophagaceae bacterium]MBP6092751.1 hypothetical protein [Cytophagaceae bacterium]